MPCLSSYLYNNTCRTVQKRFNKVRPMMSDDKLRSEFPDEDYATAF